MEDTINTDDEKINRSRCKTDKEGRERYLSSHRRYGNKKYICELCNVVIKITGKIRHNKSQKHLGQLE